MCEPPTAPLSSHPVPGGTQEQLAEAARSAVKTITQEAEYVNLGSDDMDAQLLLLTAVKDVANALGDLVSATRAASGKSHTDLAMKTLESSAKVSIK